MSHTKELTLEQQNELLETLKKRFAKNTNYHKDIEWHKIEVKLKEKTNKLLILSIMEETGGEPDVVYYNAKDNEYIFYDCSSESPKGRRSLCYDRKALEARKKYPPENSALDVADEIGIEILTEEQYRYLQTLGEFDTKTSSWVVTPKEIRDLGGALFCDRRYNTVFTYHNGADSYYATRGFRGLLRV